MAVEAVYMYVLYSGKMHLAAIPRDKVEDLLDVVHMLQGTPRMELTGLHPILEEVIREGTNRVIKGIQKDVESGNIKHFGDSKGISLRDLASTPTGRQSTTQPAQANLPKEGPEWEAAKAVVDKIKKGPKP